MAAELHYVLLDEGSCGSRSTSDPNAGDPAFLDITLQPNGTAILTGDPHTSTIPLRTHALLSGHPGLDQGNNSLAVGADGVTPLATASDHQWYRGHWFF